MGLPIDGIRLTVIQSIFINYRDPWRWSPGKDSNCAGGDTLVKDTKEEYYDVDATLCWGPMIFGMMLGGAMSRGKGGPGMMYPGRVHPGMGPVVNPARRVGMGGPGMVQGPRGTGMGAPGMPGMRYTQSRPKYPMF